MSIPKLANRPLPGVNYANPGGMMNRGLDLRVVERNFTNMTNMDLPRGEPLKYAQPYDNMNILERYNDRAMVKETDVFTAEMMNEQHSGNLSALAPLLPMVEKHMVFDKAEYHMLPFDRTAIGGVPERTFKHKETRTANLYHYIRYQSMELNYLMDPNFGRKMLNETLGVIVAQARMTLYYQLAAGLLSTAIEQSYVRFQNNTKTALQIFNETAYFALAHVSPQDLAHKIILIREPQRPYDTVISAAGTGTILAEVATETRSVNGVHYGYDEATGRYVTAVYAAQHNVASIQAGDGSYIAILQNPALYYQNIKDEDVPPTQTLQGAANLCEVVLQPPMSADDEHTGPTGRNDPVVHDQTESSISHEAIRSAAAIAATGFWNNSDGSLGQPVTHDRLSEPYIPLGEIYHALLTSYKTENESEISFWLRQDVTNDDNNTPNKDSWNQETPLADMNFRRWFPFVATNRAGKLVAPNCLFDIPERGFPMKYALKIARYILKKAKDENNGKITADYLHRFFPDGGLKAVWENASLPTKAMGKGAIDAGEGGPAAVSVAPKAADKVDFDTLWKRKYDAYKANMPAEDFDLLDDLKKREPGLGPVVADLYVAIRALVKFEVSMESIPFSDDVKELKKELKERVEALRPKVVGEPDNVKALLDWKSLPTLSHLFSAHYVPMSEEGEMLQHIPDSHIKPYVNAIEAIDRELGQSASADERAAIERGKAAVFATIRSSSGMSSMPSIIDTIDDHLSDGKSAAVFAQIPLLSGREKASETPLKAYEMKFANGIRSRIASAEDAMDIDEAPRSFKAGHFGARKDNHKDALQNFQSFADASGTFEFDRRIAMITKNYTEGEDDLWRILLYVGSATFSFGNVYNLAKRYEIQIFRMNFWRPFQKYRMLHMIACVRGPRTMVTGFSSPIVSPSFQGMEGYVNIIAQFFSAFIATEPRNIRLIPNVICAGLIANINTNFVRSQEDFASASPHKPSIIVGVVPLDEDKYQFPMHMLNHDLFHVNDANNRSPLGKHSSRDMIRQIGSKQVVDYFHSNSLTIDPMTEQDMSFVGHRSWCMYLDERLGRFASIRGTGPRGAQEVNSVEAAAVWAGHSIRFPRDPHFTKPVA